MIAWNKGLTKEEYPQLSHSGVKLGNIPWNKDKPGYSMKHEKQFKKGVEPPMHKAGCSCFRCGGKGYDATGVKQSPETIAKRVAKLMGHRPFRLPKYSADENYLRKLEKTKMRLRITRYGHTKAQWEALKFKYNYMCLCCKKYEPEIKLTKDHIIPITKGGSNYIENLQPLCQRCNSHKFTQSTSFLPSATLSYEGEGGENVKQSN
jgi:5-methylcytosine-specific restriction endonuclease McrA